MHLHAQCLPRKNPLIVMLISTYLYALVQNTVWECRFAYFFFFYWGILSAYSCVHKHIVKNRLHFSSVKTKKTMYWAFWSCSVQGTLVMHTDKNHRAERRTMEWERCNCKTILEVGGRRHALSCTVQLHLLLLSGPPAPENASDQSWSVTGNVTSFCLTATDSTDWVWKETRKRVQCLPHSCIIIGWYHRASILQESLTHSSAYKEYKDLPLPCTAHTGDEALTDPLVLLYRLEPSASMLNIHHSHPGKKPCNSPEVLETFYCW